MKKMKLYMLLLLVPLVLMGCVEKGKPASGINVDVSGTGGYTWEQLQEMVGINNQNEPYSIYYNLSDVDKLKKIFPITEKENEAKATAINNLYDELYKISRAIALKDEKTFFYTTNKANVESLDKTLTSVLSILNTTELVYLEKEIYGIDLRNLTNNTPDPKIKDFLQAIKIINSRVADYSKKNPFFSKTPMIYFFYDAWLNLSFQSYLLTTYSLNIKEINQKPAIRGALELINKEIAYLEPIVISGKPIDLKNPDSLLRALKELSVLYTKYLNDQTSLINVNDKRFDFKTLEDDLYASHPDITTLEAAIADIKNQLTNYVPSSVWKDKYAEVMNVITTYENKNLKYLSNDTNKYSTVHSKIINTLVTLEYLRKEEPVIRGYWKLNPTY